MKVKLCKCGCGQELSPRRSKQRPNLWVHGHNKPRLGIKFSPEVKAKLIAIGTETGKRNSGENNYAWKGNKVSYDGLHRWVKRWRGKAKKCIHCFTLTAKRYEWANISGEYKRDLTDWMELCSSCHHKYDNIVEKGIATKKIKKLLRERGEYHAV